MSTNQGVGERRQAEQGGYHRGTPLPGQPDGAMGRFGGADSGCRVCRSARVQAGRNRKGHAGIGGIVRSAIMPCSDHWEGPGTTHQG